MRTSPIAPADFVASLAKGLAVLECFDTQRQGLSVTLAAARAGISRAAARRQLLTLTHLGYLESDGSHYWLAPRVLRLAGSYLAGARLPRLVQPTLDRLAARTGEWFSAVVLDEREVVIVARSGPADAGTGDPRALLRAYGLHLGARLPAHATSTGRMLLATLEPHALEAWLTSHPLPRLTPYTTTDATQFRVLLDAARHADHCFASEEHEVGVMALAVPLRNMAGHALAALNVIAPPARLQRTAAQRSLLALLQDAAVELRGRL
ncbi:MAG: helix-turn-helix domain-containing protein [Pseudomonadota bacterium]|nr:helix-turn-helix domain-containing protein [Pseudomonadota bacterium]